MNKNGKVTTKQISQWKYVPSQRRIMISILSMILFPNEPD